MRPNGAAPRSSRREDRDVDGSGRGIRFRSLEGAVKDPEEETDTKPPANEYVTLVEVLQLTSTFEEFADAIRAAARRLEAEGIGELVTLQFYANPESTEAGAILTFADRDRITEHIGMITKWEEFERFFGTVEPLDVRVYGKLSAEAEAWVR